MESKKKYSVLLLRPDYVAATFGHDTFYAYVEATSIKRAIYQARRSASQTDDAEYADYFVLLAIKGHHKDISYGE